MASAHSKENLEVQATALKRRRFTVVHLCFGELCAATGESAVTVLRTFRPGTIKGWPDRRQFDEALVRFMQRSKPGGHFSVGGLAVVVRSK